MISHGDRKAQLLARLAQLTERLAGIDAALKDHNDPDWEELAVSREGDEVLEGVGVNGQHEIRRIEGALGRIDDGSYGICTKCGGEISQERLDLLPATPFCRDCAA